MIKVTVEKNKVILHCKDNTQAIEVANNINQGFKRKDKINKFIKKYM